MGGEGKGKVGGPSGGMEVKLRLSTVSDECSSANASTSRQLGSARLTMHHPPVAV